MTNQAIVSDLDPNGPCIGHVINDFSFCIRCGKSIEYIVKDRELFKIEEDVE